MIEASLFISVQKLELCATNMSQNKSLKITRVNYFFSNCPARTVVNISAEIAEPGLFEKISLVKGIALTPLGCALEIDRKLK